MIGLFRAISVIATGFLMASTVPANAATISFAGYSYDDTTNVVVGGGLEWLRWVETEGQTIDQALATYASDGWELASNAQMAELLNAFGFSSNPNYFDSDEKTRQDIYTGTDGDGTAPDDPEVQFVSLFGNTYWDFPDTVGSSDPLELSAAWFGEDADNNNFYNRVWVMDDYRVINGTGYEGLVVLDHDLYSATSAATNYGVALVRSVSPVPIPAAVWLFASALGVFGYVGKRKAKV